MLTTEKLSEMKPNSIFASGIINDRRLHTEDIKWVAVKGEITEWAIYYHIAEKKLNFIAHNGQKINIESIIKELVPCSGAAFECYKL
jgi:hypothetical protein